MWGKDLTPEVAEMIGRAFGTYVLRSRKKDPVTLTVGRDVRLSSLPISESLIKGIISTGVNVIDIGECPTPVQYFSLYHTGADGGIMVTGSHNPPEYNGFKMSAGKETLYGEGIQEIRKIIGTRTFASGSGSVLTQPLIGAYHAYLKDCFSDLSGLRVVLDAGNGTAGLIAPAVIEGLGAEVIRLFCEPDGRFPNHHPDPVVAENLEMLISRVRTTNAHAGIAYDGDADRLGVVDSEGEIIWGDRLMIIFARDILKLTPGARIIGEVKCSQVMYDDIIKQGGVPIMWKTGHSLIKKKMKEEGAVLAGEMSGHIFFADRYFGYDDAIYATLRLLEILIKNGAPYSLKRLLAGLPEVCSTPEIRVDCDDAMKFIVIEKMREVFSGYDVNTLDGARINFDDGWALVRASNTQPALVLRFEATGQSSLDRIRALVEKELEAILTSL
ncbi:MAG: phosphomannomutase/phosphoglucomutase [Nitrospirae bacterium]|nr:phosphomannomutase/phosphoglucomutase [Nitrospirota bacterium]